MVYVSLKAAETLAKEGIESEVIDLWTVLPLDEETILQSVKKTNKCLVVHEDTKTGGIAGEIAAILAEKAFHDMDGPLVRVTSLDSPVPYAPTLEETFLQREKSVYRGKRTGAFLRLSPEWLGLKGLAGSDFLSTVRRGGLPRRDLILEIIGIEAVEPAFPRFCLRVHQEADWRALRPG